MFPPSVLFSVMLHYHRRHKNRIFGTLLLAKGERKHEYDLGDEDDKTEPRDMGELEKGLPNNLFNA